ncbi:hypothetical protein [uncultured Kordia sp.]|uniref:hypothetical protein n=1 Tax=uncultured Kordia sp. TaxID=507699 RepID=UPI0026055436|nr:hypothetical protein [uncultured Kordia sp.]
MKKLKTTAFTLLSEELDNQTLMHLVGGTDATPISTLPHDLITPSRNTKPYTPGDPDEL